MQERRVSPEQRRGPSTGAPIFWLTVSVSALPMLVGVAAIVQGRGAWAAGVILLVLAYDVLQALCLLVVAATAMGRRQDMRTVAGPPALSLSGRSPSIATIIPTWNEGPELLDTVRCLLEQSEQPERIIVVDDGSSRGGAGLLEGVLALEPTAGGLARSARHPHLSVLRKPHSGKSDSLNRAIALSGTDVVMVLDADTLLLPGAMAAVREGFARDPGLTAIGGVLIPECRGGPWRGFLGFFQRYEYVAGHIWRLAWSSLDATLLISGACGAFRRDVLVGAGGFSPSSWTEDYELMYRLHRHERARGRPCRVLVHPRFLARTDAPSALRPFLRQRRRWAGGFVETLLRHRAMVGDRRLGVLGTIYLVHNTLTAPQPLWLLPLLVAGLLFRSDRFQGEVLAAVGVFVLAKVVWNAGIALARLQLYRRDVGSHGSRYGQTLLDSFLQPILYAPLLLIAQLWGIAAAAARRTSW